MFALSDPPVKTTGILRIATPCWERQRLVEDGSEFKGVLLDEKET